MNNHSFQFYSSFMPLFKEMLLVICLIFSTVTFAYSPQEGNVTANIGPYFFQTNFKNAQTLASSPYTTGVGLIVNGDINDRGALEIAMFHMNKRYLRKEDLKYISEMTQVIHITMGYRRWFNQFFSASLAFYSAYSLGEVRILHSDFDKGSEIPTSARDTTEYGFDVALQSELWKGKTFDVVGDIRYSFSVTSRDKEHSDHYGAFIGLRYLVQEKYPDKKPDKKKFD